MVAVTSVTVQANALPPAKRPGVMGAIKGDIGAAAAKRWSGVEKIAINQRLAATAVPPSNAAQTVLFVAEARIKRRC